MKRTFFFVVEVTVVAGLVATACASGPSGSVGGIPGSIQQARRNAMAMEGDMVVGIGTAHMRTVNQSRSTASNRAVLDIMRQLELMVDYMAVDLQVGSEVDHQAALAFQREIQRTLARQTVRGATTVEEFEDRNGQYWVAMRISRSAARTEILNASQAAARLAPSAAAAMWALEEMDRALDRAIQQNNSLPPQYRAE